MRTAAAPSTARAKRGSSIEQPPQGAASLSAPPGGSGGARSAPPELLGRGTYELVLSRDVRDEVAAVAFGQAARRVARPAVERADVEAAHVHAERTGLAVGVARAAGARAVAVAPGEAGALAAALGVRVAACAVGAAATAGAAGALREALARLDGAALGVEHAARGAVARGAAGAG